VGGADGHQRVGVLEAVDPVDDLLPLPGGDLSVRVRVEKAEEDPQGMVPLPIGVPTPPGPLKPGGEFVCTRPAAGARPLSMMKSLMDYPSHPLVVLQKEV